jgi:hypothetical protein
MMYALGLAVGLAVGFVTGHSVGKGHKPWSALTPKEKKLKLISIGLGVVMLVAGVIAFLAVKAKAG